MAMLPECHPCLERLVGLAVELATPDPEVRRRASESARRCLDQEFGPGAIPACHRQPVARHYPSDLREP